MGKHVVNCKESSDASHLFYYYYYYYYYYFGCAGSFAACVGFLWLQQVGATLWLWCSGFSLQRLLLLLGTGWRVLRLQELWHMGSAAPQHVGSSQTRDQTHVPCTGRQILNH